MSKSKNTRWFKGTWPILSSLERSDSWHDILSKFMQNVHADFIEGQCERDANKTWICFRVHFPNCQRMSKFQNFPCDITPITQEEANPDRLFSKQHSIDGPWHIGIPPSAGRKSKYTTSDYDYDTIITAAKDNRIDDIPSKILINNYHNIRSLTKDYMKLPPDAKCTKGIWVFGGVGVGKSTWARNYLAHKGMEIYVKDSQNKWWDGYSGQGGVIIDDFDFNSLKPLGTYLKQVCDRFTCTVEIKGGTVPMCASIIVITSNYSLAQLFPPEIDLLLYKAIKRRFRLIKYPVSYNDPKTLKQRKPRDWDNPCVAAKSMTKYLATLGGGVDDWRLLQSEGIPIKTMLTKLDTWRAGKEPFLCHNEEVPWKIRRQHLLQQDLTDWGVTPAKPRQPSISNQVNLMKRPILPCTQKKNRSPETSSAGNLMTSIEDMMSKSFTFNNNMACFIQETTQKTSLIFSPPWKVLSNISQSQSFFLAKNMDRGWISKNLSFLEESDECSHRSAPMILCENFRRDGETQQISEIPMNRSSAILIEDISGVSPERKEYHELNFDRVHDGCEESSPELHDVMKRSLDEFTNNATEWETIVKDFNKYIQPNFGLIIHDVGHDGNCLFRSIAHQIERTELNHLFYRKLACDILQRDWEKGSLLHLPKDTEREKYLETMMKSGIWGTEVEVMALARGLNTTITLFETGREPMVCTPRTLTNIDEKEEGQQLHPNNGNVVGPEIQKYYHLGHHRHAHHFTSLIYVKGENVTVSKKEGEKTSEEHCVHEDPRATQFTAMSEHRNMVFGAEENRRQIKDVEDQQHINSVGREHDREKGFESKIPITNNLILKGCIYCGKEKFIPLNEHLTGTQILCSDCGKEIERLVEIHKESNASS